MKKNINDLFDIGDSCFFEYHCLESHDSVDSDLWYRSHQKVVVLKLEDIDFDILQTRKDRLEQGQPLSYKVKFEDGFIGTAMEDELMISEDMYSRPGPPQRPTRNG